MTMRRDLILPALLFVALLALGVYATTAERAKGAAADPTATGSPANCESARLISRLSLLPEASGLAASRRFRDLFWSHNDSSDPVLYAIGGDGTIKGQVRLTGASVVDWEAITVSECNGEICVYVGDIGDNQVKRRTITIYRTREPAPTESATTPIERIDASYAEGPQDAEALFIAKGSLFVVTKGEDAPIRIYRRPLAPGAAEGAAQSGGRVQLELVATLTDADPRKTARITDAAVSPNGQWVAMRTNDVVLFYPTDALLAANPGTPLVYDLAALKEPQGEGIAWADDRTLYLAGEAQGGGTFARITCALPQ